MADMTVYDDRERFPYSMYGLSLLLAGPFVYLALTRFAMIYLQIYGQCTFNNFTSQCPAMPEASLLFNSFSAINLIYDRVGHLKPEIKFIALFMYICAVLIAFIPFAFRNYRAGAREYFMLGFLAAGALSTIVVK